MALPGKWPPSLWRKRDATCGHKLCLTVLSVQLVAPLRLRVARHPTLACMLALQTLHADQPEMQSDRWRMQVDRHAYMLLVHALWLFAKAEGLC